MASSGNSARVSYNARASALRGRRGRGTTLLHAGRTTLNASSSNASRRRELQRQPAMLILTEADRLLFSEEPGEALGVLSDEDDDAPDRKVKLTLRDANLIFAMPFFCTIATRLPFIYFVIQLKGFGLSSLAVGLCVGAFHLCRVFAIAGSIFATRASHLVGSILGIAGYACLLVFSDTSNAAVFASCNIVAGLAEASAAVFVYSKQVYVADVDKMRYAMSNQSAFIGVAVILGFFFGGMAFEVWGVPGIAVCGIAVLGLELLSLLYFLLAPPVVGGNKEDSENERNDDANANGGAGQFRKTKMVKSIQSEGRRQGTIMRMYSESKDIASNNFTYLVAIVFSIESIACGYLFSIGPLFIFETFGVNQGKIGTIFSAASLFGTILTFIAISPKGRNLQRRYARSPYNLYFLIATISLSVLGLMIPSFPVQVICILLLIGCCELFLTLLSELQGSITTSQYYSTLGPSAQMLRRIMNVAMAVTGPIFYGIFSRLPYIVAGSLCVVYTISFIVYTQRQQKQNADKIELLLVTNAGLEGKDAEDLVRQYNRMTMSSKECLARMASCTFKILEEGDEDEEEGEDKQFEPLDAVGEEGEEEEEEEEEETE